MRSFCPHLGSFLFLWQLQKFGIDPIMEDQIRIYKTKKSILDRPSGPMAQRIEARVYNSGEHCQKIGEHCLKKAVSNPTQAGQRFTWSKTWCDRQQLWKAVITGDTVTRLIIPIRGRGKLPEEGQRWKFGQNVVKEETTQKKLPRWRQKVRKK